MPRTLAEENEYESLTAGYMPIDMSAFNSVLYHGKRYFWLADEEMYIHINDIGQLSSGPHVPPTAPRWHIYGHSGHEQIIRM